MVIEIPGFFLFSKTTTINPAPYAADVCCKMPRNTDDRPEAH